MEVGVRGMRMPHSSLRIIITMVKDLSSFYSIVLIGETNLCYPGEMNDTHIVDVFAYYRQK